MLDQLAFAGSHIFQSQRRQVDFEKRGSSDLNMHVLEEAIDAVGQWKNGSIH